jgi:N-acetylneuraminic acid mutarotase
MKEVFAGKPSTVEWTNLESMKEPRSNFMHAVIDNKIYVYGGIKGKSSQTSHAPLMNETLCEIYDPIANTWTS